MFGERMKNKQMEGEIRLLRKGEKVNNPRNDK
jgi:hypothetical protein